jgi:phosphoglycerol transferase MdoB-like AlkP superfamily enzyme
MNISFRFARIYKYIPLVAILYIVFAIALITGTGRSNGVLLTILCAVMPLVILLLGICDIDIRSKVLLRCVRLALIFLTPEYIITFVLDNGGILLLTNRLMNYLVIFVFMTLLMLIFLRTDIAILITSVLCCTIFITNCYVTKFRGMPFMTSDILAFNTAVAVSESARFFVGLNMLLSAECTFLLILIASKLSFAITRHTLAARLTLSGILLFGCILLIALPNVLDLRWRGYNSFSIAQSNARFGTLMTMLVNTRGMFIQHPDGYSDDAAQAIIDENTPTAEKATAKPNIIVIMDEAFSDYTEIYNVKPSQDPLEYWHSLNDENTVSGDLLVPVFGGGTCFTEFEFLSGIGGGILSNGYNVYLQGIHQSVHTLATDLDALGYKSIGIHPFWANCWNRDKVYPLMGFDDFISGEDFDPQTPESEEAELHPTPYSLGDLDYVREYPSDKESFNKIKEQFENKSPDERLFVFNVTVQNHSGYSYEGDNFKTDVTSEESTSPQLNQYLSLLKYSDDAYRELIEYFKSYDEPTVILLFGDHQPGLDESSDINEPYASYGKMRKYITCYKLWANYDLGDSKPEGGITSAGFLSLKLKEAADLPLNGWDVFRQRLSEHFTGVSVYGCAATRDNKLAIKQELTEDEEQLTEQYKLLEYYLLFRQGLLNK